MKKMDKEISLPPVGISLQDALPFLFKLVLLEQQAQTQEGVAVPYKFTIHTHGYTLLMEGTIKASKGQ